MITDCEQVHGIPKLLTPVQVADALGISVVTVRSWERDGRLPALRPGGLLRFDAEAVRAFVAAAADAPRRQAPPRLLQAGGRPRGRRSRRKLVSE